MILFKTLIFTLVVPGTVLVCLPWVVSQSAPPSFGYHSGALRYFGAVPALAGAAVYFRCAWDFATRGRGTPAPIDPPRALVARGLYRYVRNP
ncbi:MAG: isoprenylcysteine carboxylmethyltransferase family protein, partial [Myxococcota bacterium]